MIARRRDGREIETYDGQKGILTFLYGHPLGQQLLKLLICPGVSKFCGWVLSRRISSLFIRPFVQKNELDLTDYPQRRYRSFNDFFTRQIIPGRRPVTAGSEALIAPCDGKLTVYQITDDAQFMVKGVRYTLESLLRNQSLAERYAGGTLLLFRLTVDDYHRYVYPCDGAIGQSYKIPGVFHTVNPLVAERLPVYRENSREYAVLESPRFGSVLTMEVGAMLVGKITNPHGVGTVTRGDEKGYFQFGGSTVILIVQRDKLIVDADLQRNADAGVETCIRMGEQIGYEKKALL